MTILFLARRFYPEIGGVEKHVMEIGKRLVKKRHNVDRYDPLFPDQEGELYYFGYCAYTS